MTYVRVSIKSLNVYCMCLMENVRLTVPVCCKLMNVTLNGFSRMVFETLNSFCIEAERISVQGFQDPLSSRRRVGSEPRDPLSQSPLPEHRTPTDPLSLMAEQISVGSQDTVDGLEALPRDEGSRVGSVGRQTPHRSLAMDNYGFDNTEATDSAWSPEVCDAWVNNSKSLYFYPIVFFYYIRWILAPTPLCLFIL